MQQLDPLSAIASPPPQIGVDRIARLVAEQYGFEGEIKPLVSERDQNFQITTASQQRYVVKIANAAERPINVDFQIKALLHLQDCGCNIAVPRIIRTLDDSSLTKVREDGVTHALRVVSHVPGRPLESVTPDVQLAYELGACLARIGIALNDFEHPGDSQSLLWDMQQASALRPLLKYIAADERRLTIQTCLDDFEQRALAPMSSLRKQVIHNDFNPGNVLITDDEPLSVVGVIDFGDMTRAPLINDVAIAAAYLRSESEDPLALIASFVAGYNASTHLDDVEIGLLYDLVRMRLATTIAILCWRQTARSDDDAYLIKSMQGVGSADRFLARINAISRAGFTDRMQQECGR